MNEQRDEEILISAAGRDRDQQRDELQRLIVALNSRLALEKERSATFAAPLFFGGCGLLLLVSAWLYLRMDITIGVIVTIMGGIGVLLLMLSIALDNYLEARYMHIGYQQIIEPQIRSYLVLHELTEQQFGVLAHAVLSKDAPLRKFLFGVAPESQADPPV